MTDAVTLYKLNYIRFHSVYQFAVWLDTHTHTHIYIYNKSNCEKKNSLQSITEFTELFIVKNIKIEAILITRLMELTTTHRQGNWSNFVIWKPSSLFYFCLSYLFRVNYRFQYRNIVFLPLNFEIFRACYFTIYI